MLLITTGFGAYFGAYPLLKLAYSSRKQTYRLIEYLNLHWGHGGKQ